MEITDKKGGGSDPQNPRSKNLPVTKTSKILSSKDEQEISSVLQANMLYRFSLRLSFYQGIKNMAVQVGGGPSWASGHVDHIKNISFGNSCVE